MRTIRRFWLAFHRTHNCLASPLPHYLPSRQSHVYDAVLETLSVCFLEFSTFSTDLIIVSIYWPQHRTRLLSKAT
ncbi:hypothetical protein EDB85DRAFT_2052563 [Lactarius pseudohatsudake]|nr:hypothetical protein EDB85DRAFT_2052563 [Lactarius pseudohatsudake]